jgi:hypothetical protein
MTRFAQSRRERRAAQRNDQTATSELTLDDFRAAYSRFEADLARVIERAFADHPDPLVALHAREHVRNAPLREQAYFAALERSDV